MEKTATAEMTRDEYWTIVESVNWAELSSKSDSGVIVEDRSYEVGKRRLLKALPTLADSQAFSAQHVLVTEKLYAYFTEWVNEIDGDFRGNRTTDLGDDSFGDLIAHIIGLGWEEYERVFENPRVMQKRGLDYDFTESFAYCLPDKSNYEPVRFQLARETRGLLFWQRRLTEDPESACNQNEIEWRGRACERLRERLVAEGGTEMTQKAYETHCLAERAADLHASIDRSKAKAKAKEKLLADFEKEWA